MNANYENGYVKGTLWVNFGSNSSQTVFINLIIIWDKAMGELESLYMTLSAFSKVSVFSCCSFEDTSKWVVVIF